MRNIEETTTKDRQDRQTRGVAFLQRRNREKREGGFKKRGRGEAEIHARYSLSEEPVPLGPLEDRRLDLPAVCRLVRSGGRREDLRCAGLESSQPRGLRRERKLSWLASFHQDATLARSVAAILLRSAPPTSQQSRLQLDFLFFFSPLSLFYASPSLSFSYWSQCARRMTCTHNAVGCQQETPSLS